MKFMSFACGLLFAIGLGFAGMTQPSKVTGFLDIFGEWNPSLLFVMGGALAVHASAFRLIRRRPSPILAPRFEIPEDRAISPTLVIGASLFGLGWGIAGYCPAPVLVALASFKTEPILFVGAMIFGMLGATLALRLRKS
jgi:uncharacterized membrane protein YedE/YeeE